MIQQTGGENEVCRRQEMLRIFAEIVRNYTLTAEHVVPACGHCHKPQPQETQEVV